MHMLFMKPALYPRLAFSGTAVAGLAYGSGCPPATDDIKTCPQIRGIAGFRFSPRARLNQSLGLGLSGGVVWLGDSKDLSTKWWDLQLEGRYYLGKAAVFQGWLAASFGVVNAVESILAYAGADGTNHSAHSIGTRAPCGAMKFGHDYELTRYLGLAPELRFYGFHDSTPPVIYEQPQTALILGLSVIGFGAYR
jgi:hypothetical protein